ncbi:S-DNA-T family DNA segregation ATPase FtsK/SpoIIIE [Allocatelliglobosispora scoriae]|uniref:S-DNA-T family DNA segregation ATPase FtsK/SpoIIIE n=1 Tax=Allocatelliglobosispora scoriae TaxID=643052 RepID=A0A841BEP7_9ACTN|nr:type VII secretion protein EccCa [Allocatelliglobosispora scoriae]MBB5867557.1 S-DNA-T family DNA segregation ATPase FtsK/SpoIIIE [Allocatelliglobosispora scoriae]
MSTVVRRRPPRRPMPPYPAGDVVIEQPSEIPEAEGKSWSRVLMLLPMGAGAVAMALLFAGQSGSTLRLITGGLLGVSMLGMVAMQFSQHSSGGSKSEMRALRRNYLFELGGLRRNVRTAIRAQWTAEYYRHPQPQALWSLVDSSRLWERRADDADFGQIRIGLGQRDLATPLIAPPFIPMEKAEPVSAGALRRFLATYRQVPQLPVVLAVTGFAKLHVLGDERQARSLVRAIVAQSAFFHAPDDLLVAVCAGSEERLYWEWAKWLPHAAHPTDTDALGPLRLLAPSVVGLEALLDTLLARRPRFSPSAVETEIDGPHLLVVIDGGETVGSDHLTADVGLEGVLVVEINGRPPRHPDRSTLLLRIAADGTLTAGTYDSSETLGLADGLSLVAAEALAHQLSPLRLAAAATGGQAMASVHGLSELLDIGDPYTLDPVQTWLTRPNRDRLRVPIGIGADGSRVELDLKESAQDGMGPHGLLIGATGSGKSELLRTLVLALAITHPPEVLNLVLVDFKGGATFVTLDKLPHTSAVITNLADELPLVDRMTDAINGELVRRQELLRKAGNYVSQREYERARAAGVPLAPLPSLLIVCDEFSELLSVKPDFIDMFVQIGRVGRSLGVHLLLASQRLEEGRLRGLDTHLSYRIGLRTFSPLESRTVLGVTDAYELPRAPGHGYLKFGTEEMTRFRAAYVSGAHKRDEARPAQVDGEQVHAFVSGYVAPQRQGADAPAVAAAETLEDVTGETLLDILTGRLVGQGTPAHQVWLPPLDLAPSLSELTGPVAVTAGRGLATVDTAAHRSVTVNVGLVDKPFEQRRDPLRLDLAGANGHMIVVGAPQSGKSGLLRTMMMNLAVTHTPREVQFYCLDFGGALTPLRELPHVGGVATRHEANQVRRTVAELTQLLTEREQLFASRGIDSMATYRRLLARGEIDGAHGDVFLIVDGWLSLRNDFEDLEGDVMELANRGLAFGVHVIGTCGRWMDLRPSIRDVFGTRLELRLGDPSDSVIGRRAAANVPQQAPGRGITPESYQFLTGYATPDELAELVGAVRAAWDGDAAPRVRLLPAEVAYTELPQRPDQPGPVIGLAEHDLQPVYLEADADPHFLVFGDTECGKSGFLRTLARSISDHYRPEQARIIAVDYRRSLLGAIPDSHLLGYGISAKPAADLIAEIADVFRQRLPGADVTPDQLRKRDWWSGPELFLLVDDYDLVAGDRNPLGALVEYLPQSREVGLHLVLARRSGGASRSFFDASMSRLRDLNTPGLVMSGDRNEGPLLGSVRPSTLPPGRGWLVTRKHGPRLVQLGWSPPPL